VVALLCSGEDARGIEVTLMASKAMRTRRSEFGGTVGRTSDFDIAARRRLYTSATCSGHEGGAMFPLSPNIDSNLFQDGMMIH